MKIISIIKILAILEDEISTAQWKLDNAKERDIAEDIARCATELEEITSAYNDLKRSIEHVSITLEA